jgi:hypothetical protein
MMDMTVSELATAVAIHVLVPFFGVIVFLLLCRRMFRANIPSPPYFSCFVLFGTFGGWLLVALTAVFWKWSGMASIGVFALALVAPFVTTALAWSLRSRRGLSRFHRGAFAASVGYSGVMFVAVAGWLAMQILAR